jgi:hypothetical protein
VNLNIYDAKEDVYLNGGPGINAPDDAAGLPAGTYSFQVTDPSGKTLLSSDDVSADSSRSTPRESSRASRRAGPARTRRVRMGRMQA